MSWRGMLRLNSTREHPREAKRLERRIRSIDDKLSKSVADAKLHKLLEAAHQRLLQQLQETNTPCNRMPLFHEPNAQLDCSQLVKKSGCGLADYLAPGEVEDPELAALLYSPLYWQYTEGVWNGPLFVIVDEHTASASEQFATLLQANQAATIVGSRTVGAGCGYVDGGFPIELPNVGLRVLLPNCVRYRADGNNELEGVEPDITVWTKHDKNKARARKLAAALAAHH